MNLPSSSVMPLASQRSPQDSSTDLMVSRTVSSSPSPSPQAASSPTGLFAFSTRNFDAMLRFFLDLGFVRVTGPGAPGPLFNAGRGAFLTRGEIAFNLEECTTRQSVAAFNLWVLDFSPEEMLRISKLGYDYTCVEGIQGSCRMVKSPDGGLVMF